MTDTITLPRSVVEQALGALVRAELMHRQPNLSVQEALRAALEQPQPLPSPIWRLVPTTMTNAMAQADQELRHAVPWVRWEAILAAAPQPPALEQPQGEQEPPPNGATHKQPKQGAFYKRVDGKWYVWSRMENDKPHRWYISPGTTESCLEPLYTHPQPPRQPLTDEQIRAMWSQFAPIVGGTLDFARAIERAHGIGGEAKTRMCPSTYYECSRGCGDGGCKDFSDAHGMGGGEA